MKQKRTKPRPIAKKGHRYPPETPEEWRRHIEALACDEYLDYANDCEKREYKKSDKYKQAQQLADKFKKRVK